MATLSIGCKSDSDDDSVLPDFVYLPDILPFPMPDGIDWINSVTATEDSIFFTASAAPVNPSPFHYSSIYKMDLTDLTTQVLPNYSVAADFPANADDGNVQIYSLYIDNDGNIWVAERGEFYSYPDDGNDDEEDWERWNRRTLVEDFTRVRKLDSLGAEISSHDISHVSSGNDWFYISAFTIDDDNNIYVGANSAIYVLSSEGLPLFTLDVMWVDSLIKMQDGSIAYTDWGDKGRVFMSIDVAGRKSGETMQLPNNVNSVYSGNDEYSYLFTDYIGLYGFEAESEESVLLLKWIDSDILLDGLGSITLLSDGRVLLTSQIWNNTGSQHELIFLTKTPYSELPEKTVLSLATFNLDWAVRGAIVRFNRASATHRIHVTDYAEFGTDEDWQAGLTRLSAEIIAGKVPDILDVSNLPFSQYAAKDLLLDLYPLIDSDPGLNRSDFMESALRATEIDNKLYKIFPQFSIATFLGNPLVVGDYPGWNMEEFMAVLSANPDADIPLGQGITKLTLLQILFMFNMSDYINWEEGKVFFDSAEFIALLEYANTLPEEFDWGNDYRPEHELITSGQQILTLTAYNSFQDFQMYRAMFGGEIVFKGLPAENRNGFSLMTQSSFAITSKCKDVDVAWEFIRTFLNEDWQKENIHWGIPMNRHAFEKQLNEAMEENEYGHGSMGWNGFTVELEALTQADADQIMALINSVSGSVGQDEALWNIISESVASFFNGQSSAQDVARIIQNRASTYVSERS